jgi:hypothetical protein
MSGDLRVPTIGGAAPSAAVRPANIGMWLMGAFAAWMWLQTFWAESPALHFEGCVLFTKYVILIFLLERPTAAASSWISDRACPTRTPSACIWSPARPSLG